MANYPPVYARIIITGGGLSQGHKKKIRGQGHGLPF